MVVTTNISNAVSSDYTNKVASITIDPLQLDGVTEQEETTFQNTLWSQYWGYFNAIPELHSALLMKSIWTVGKGYTCDPRTSVILDHITGWGKDTFKDVLFNLDLVKNIGGDSFAEIIRSKDGLLMNLKPLDPSTIRIVVNKKGIIIRYEQTAKIGGIGGKAIAEFRPDEIFHLSNCRVADQIHGISRIKAMENTILAMNEGFTDTKKLMHHQAKPFIIWKLKTDNPAKIAEIVAKIDAARNLGEDMFIPDDDDAVVYEVVQVNPSPLILNWLNDLNNKFYRAVGMPLVLFGQAGTTESGGKVEYTGHQQVWEFDQEYIEKQVWSQLYLKINLLSPESLINELKADTAKDANQGLDANMGGGV